MAEAGAASLMATDADKRPAADVDKRPAVDDILSYADDLAGVLRASNDSDANAQTGAAAGMLLSACRSDSDELELKIKGSAPLLPCWKLFSPLPHVCICSG